jgi:O-antigen ligase
MKSLPTADSDRSATTCLAAALVVLPLLQALPVDFDRTGGLVLLLPALWAGRREFARALAAISHGPKWLSASFGVAAIAVVVSVCRADQPAPAAVEAATWLFVAAAGLIAGQVTRADPAAGRRLLAALAAGPAVGIAAVWLLWLAGGRGALPLYAHPRILGLHMIGGAIASTALLVRPAASRAGHAAAWVAGVCVWAGMLWSGGRAPLLAVAVGLAAWFFVRPGDRRRIAFVAIAQLLGGLALSAAFWTPRAELGWWHALERTHVAATSGSVSGLTSTRTDFWRETAQRARLTPWLGHGPDAYRFLTPKLDGEQPHNFVLSLWLDLGVLGAVPLLVLLASALGRGWSSARRARGDAADLSIAWGALLVASVVGGLLDGVFYHLLALLPALVAWGIALELTPPPEKSAAAAPLVALGRGALVGAGGVLLWHSFVFYLLALAAPPPTPNAWPARVVRTFPSTTFGLTRWLDGWQRDDPAAALAWARWAQTHSANPPAFHIYAATLLATHGDRADAERELLAAAATAHWTSRPAIAAMLQDLHSLPP